MKDRFLHLMRADPGFRRAFFATSFVWAAGYALLEIVVRMNNPPGEEANVLTSVLQFGGAVGLTAILMVVVVAVRDRPQWQRWTITALVFLAVWATQAVIDMVANWGVAQVFEPTMRHWAELSLAQYVRGGFLYFWVFGLNLVLIHLSLAQTRMVDQQHSIAHAESQATHAQLAMLRYQLNPHFLFNTLNAISSLVVTRRNDEAEEMLGKLSAFLRASLASAPDGLVPLDAEIDVLQDYLEIERVRFGERLLLEFDVAEDSRALAVPSLILQPLVENAIKYAVEPAPRPVTVRVGARRAGDRLVMTVTDDGEGRGERRGGTGVGLANIRARLDTLYGAGGTLRAAPADGGGFAATIEIPATPA